MVNPPQPNPPIPTRLVDQIPALKTQGLSQGAVAKELGISRSSVVKYSKTLGLVWDTTKTREATLVKQRSNVERRVELAEGLLEDALRLRKGLFKQGMTPGDQDRLLSAVLKAAQAFEKFDTTTGSTHEVSLLDDIRDMFVTPVNVTPPVTEDDPVNPVNPVNTMDTTGAGEPQ